MFCPVSSIHAELIARCLQLYLYLRTDMVPQRKNKGLNSLGQNRTHNLKYLELFCKQLDYLEEHQEWLQMTPQGRTAGGNFLKFGNHLQKHCRRGTHSSDLNFLFLVAGRGDEGQGKINMQQVQSLLGSIFPWSIAPCCSEEHFLFCSQVSIYFWLCARYIAAQWPYQHRE